MRWRIGGPRATSRSAQKNNMTTSVPNSLTTEIKLRDVIESDLPIFFEHQRNPDANHMAAFPARDWVPFMAHWAKILADKTVIIMTVIFNGQIAGNIVSWEQSDDREVGYWFGREYWGKGIATAALSQFLDYIKTRPLHAHVAKHNITSLRVLEKGGFTITGEDKYSNADGDVVEEFILELGANAGDEAQ